MAARVLILGGGFAGIYTALKLDRQGGDEIEVTVVSRQNFFLFTPMLSEVATSAIDTRHIVSPIRRFFNRSRFIEGEVENIDLAGQQVQVRLPSGELTAETYDQLVITLGSVINYYNLPGVEEFALPLKTLGDAVAIRNHVIEQLEIADVLPREQQTPYLTFVVAGGNFSGIELTGELNDFIREAARAYPNVRKEDIRMVLLEASDRLIREVSPRLGAFAHRKLTERGVEVHLDAAVQSAGPDYVRAKGAGEIPTRTLIWTAGVSPTPFASGLPVQLNRGRIVTDGSMRVAGWSNVWAAGDVASIPDRGGSPYPQTAQHAIREGGHLARNIMLALRGMEPRPFRYGTMGMLATIGHRAGVGEIMGIRVSGFIAWWMWRTYYLFRLPRVDRRVRVLLDWTLDLLFPRDIVELSVRESRGSRSERE